MRIGIFSESYEPILNGVSVCVRTLRDELTRRGHDVYVFAPAFRGHVDSLDTVFRLPSTHTCLMPDYPFPIPCSPKIHRIFDSLQFDIVHTQTPFLLGMLGASWARRAGIPVVSTNHTLYTEYAHYVPICPKAITQGALIRLMRWYYSRCDAIVVPSRPVGRMLRSYGIDTPVEVISTGVVGAAPLSVEQREEVRTQWGVGPDDFLLLYVGRIAREKNMRMLLTALSEVRRDHPNARLLFVGGGPAMQESRRFAAELGLDDVVRFAGMLQRPQIDPLYAASDTFVFPSTTETQGLAVCEALSAGLPVVAVNAGGIPENIQPGVDGFLTADDPREFADRIRFLITHDRERREMSAQARVNGGHFSVDRMVSDFETFYSSVISGKLAALPGVAEGS